MNKVSILFLCTGNSCRSQMVEGWTHHLKGDIIDVQSAGIEVLGLNPFAVQVMAEAGIDISSQYSKSTTELINKEFDYVITVCSDADARCPVFPAKTRIIHHGFDDPPKLAAQVETEEEKLECYRQVRDKIRAYIETLPESLAE